MSDQLERGMRLHSSFRSPLESQNATVINIHRATTLFPLLSQVCTYLSQARNIFDVIYHFCRFPSVSPTAPRGLRKAVAHILRCLITFTILVQLILYVMLGVTSHLASQAHAVARNTRSITLAVCTLPVPFKDIFCTGISDQLLSPLKPDVDHSQPWHPFLINESIHGPAVDFAVRKAANATSVVLALVRASDLTQRHGLSDKLNDFLQRARASEISSGSHIALVKTVIDE
jgi:hypothetical protein